jgi:hypothetical protein
MLRNRELGRVAGWVVLTVAAVAGAAQQVVQRGPLGVPSQLFDDTQQWTTPLQVAANNDLALYIPDVSNAAWLSRNYPDFENKGLYTVSILSHYLRPHACRQDLVRWGMADAAHLDACAADIAYRVYQVQVDTLQRTVTLQGAFMVGPDGQALGPASAPQANTRRWVDLDATAQAALAKTTELVRAQMSIYDRRIRNAH